MGEHTTIRLPGGWFFEPQRSGLWFLVDPKGRNHSLWRGYDCRAFASAVASSATCSAGINDLHDLSMEATPGEWRVEENADLIWGASIVGDDNQVDRLGLPILLPHQSSNFLGLGEPTGKQRSANARLAAAAVNFVRQVLAKATTPGTDAVREVGHG